ncbi:MAG: L-aspartate oxidase [Nitrospinota bacterium]
MEVIETDILIIGSGIAGLTFALHSGSDKRVTIVTKRSATDSNTAYAQGGIAAVLGDNDSVESHRADTILAGSNLSDEEAVDILVNDSKRVINWLEELNVTFATTKRGKYDLGQEGGHTYRRVAHTNDQTGLEIVTAALNMARSRSNIKILEDHIAINLISRATIDNKVKAGTVDDKVLGVYLLETKNNKILAISAKVTVIATGGAGKVFFYTSNPDVASGDGISLAYRASALIANMEFVQFHPTCLYHPLAKSFLISEATRGEKAELLTADGRAFMQNYHKLGSLAPRDVVARAIDQQMKKDGSDYVLLDTTRIDPDYFKRRFPSIYSTCRRYGYDPTKEPINVAPAAHYICGGIKTNLHAQSSLANLFAVGEAASTGVHGANRLASNSLLEAIVFAKRGAIKADELLENASFESFTIPRWNKGSAADDDEKVVIQYMWDEVRRLTWNYLGIARTNKRLYRAKRRLINLKEEVNKYYWQFTLTSDAVELRNLVDCASIMVESALARRESVGLHYNLDYPYRLDEESATKTTIVSKESMQANGWSW